ncbi:Plasma membrane-associated cation-binding protein 2 [Hirschfeldia incana]|nr:Plasma membrane-associated cation-binding protein 2 [Hirschfeldia incana]
MGYWKSKIVPTMKKLFERSPTNKDVVAETSKTLTFDDSKEEINKEIEEKKTELEPKVLDIYEATSAELKALVREPKEDGLTKHSAEVHKFLEALVEIGFPGSKDACELSSTSSGPVTFIFEKVCVFLPVEEKSREVENVEEVAKTEEPSKEEDTKPAKEDEITTAEKEKETVEEKKEEVLPALVPVVAAAEEKKPAVEEEKKEAVEEKKPEVEEQKKPVEEVNKEVVAASAPQAETPPTMVTAVPVVETPVKAPETLVPEPKMA